MIEAKMPLLRGREFKCEVDGARPHTGTNTVEELQAGGNGEMGSSHLNAASKLP